MNYSIQQLTEKDVSLMQELNQLFASAFDDDPAYTSKAPSKEYLQSFLQHKQHIVLVAKDSEKVIGGLVAYVLQKFEQERAEVYIYDLAVAKEYRRQKVATNCIKELQTMAAELGAYVIFVQADYGDEPAIKLYQSLGKQEEVLHFDIDVN